MPTPRPTSRHCDSMGLGVKARLWYLEKSSSGDSDFSQAESCCSEGPAGWEDPSHPGKKAAAGEWALQWLLHPARPPAGTLSNESTRRNCWPPTHLPAEHTGCLLCVCTAEETTSLASVTPELRKQRARTKQTGGVRRALIQVYREIFIPELQDAKYPTGLLRTRESLQDPPPWPLVSLIHRLLEA